MLRNGSILSTGLPHTPNFLSLCPKASTKSDGIQKAVVSQDVLPSLCVFEGSGLERPQRWHLTNTLEALVLELRSPSGVALSMSGLF